MLLVLSSFHVTGTGRGEGVFSIDALDGDIFYFILYTALMFVQSKYVYDYTYNISLGVCLGDVGLIRTRVLLALEQNRRICVRVKVSLY
jgi:hypothetical protein